MHLPELLLFIERLRGEPIEVDDLRPGDFGDIDTLVLRFCTAEVRSMTGPVEACAASGCAGTRAGQAGLRGPLLALADDCDRAFMSSAAIWHASEERIRHRCRPPAAARRLSAFLSSPGHLSAHLDPAGLADFLSGEVLGEHGEVAVTRLSPVTEVLTPAACYHIYSGREGESLDQPLT